jgi:hypothetical protein
VIGRAPDNAIRAYGRVNRIFLRSDMASNSSAQLAFGNVLAGMIRKARFS